VEGNGRGVIETLSLQLTCEDMQRAGRFNSGPVGWDRLISVIERTSRQCSEASYRCVYTFRRSTVMHKRTETAASVLRCLLAGYKTVVSAEQER
jgi:hypothetical protein